MKFKLSKYIIPTTIAMVLVSIYTNVDGLFIGNVMGDDGLAGINIAWPIVALITALGTGIGVGGSVIISSLRGEKNEEHAQRAKYTALVLLFLAGIFATVFFLTLFKPLLKLMGAEGLVLEYASNYSFVIALGAVFQVVGAGIVVLLRNDGQTVHSMLYTFIGLVVHIVLDILLVKNLKLYGIAISTVVSQLVIMVLGMISLSFKKEKLYKMKTMLITSVAPFGLNFVPSLTLLVTNFFALKIGGTAGVSAYAVMSYVVFTYEYIFQGICDGVQPVLSFTSGKEHIAERKRTEKTGISILVVLAVIMLATTPLVSKFLPVVFAVSKEAEEMMKTGLIIYSFSYVFKAIVKWICAYSYSVNNILSSNILTYIEPILFSPLCLLILPKFFGMNGIWLSQTVSQILACVLGVILLCSFKKKSKMMMENN